MFTFERRTRVMGHNLTEFYLLETSCASHVEV